MLSGGQVSYELARWTAPACKRCTTRCGRRVPERRARGRDGVVQRSAHADDGYALKGANVAYGPPRVHERRQDAGAHSPYLDTMVWRRSTLSGRWAFAAVATEFGTAAQNMPLLQTGTNYFTTLVVVRGHDQSWACGAGTPVPRSLRPPPVPSEHGDEARHPCSGISMRIGRVGKRRWREPRRFVT